MRLCAPLLAALCLWGCDRRPADGIAPAAGEHQDGEVLNLLDGVVVTHRTGELQLGTSALNAIDGQPTTLWSSPPGDPGQSMTIALPARTRLRRVGISSGTTALSGWPVSRLAFETSLDGKQFEPLQTISAPKAADRQLFQTRPIEANAVRIRILETLRPGAGSDLPEILVEGDELQPPRRGILTGTWRLNHQTAHLVEQGRRIYGRVEMDPPMLLEGAWHDRVARLAWVRGKQFGVAVLAIDPAGEHLSGFWWFREAIPPFLGGPWFGRKSAPTASANAAPAAAELSLRERQTFPLYGLQFDERDRLSGDNSAAMELLKKIVALYPTRRFRITANEVRAASAEDDRRRSEQQIAGLRAALQQQGFELARIQLSPAGRQYSRDPGGMPYYSLMHSRIDLELVEE